ncbi:hypothetical protein EDB89DRAFT_2148919, partial [Lactarius sanguifluus]
LNMQGADVIFRSSDHVSFRVHKSILAISSPFFTDLFSLPQPLDGEVIEGLPVVQVSEDAELLHSLFTVLYPIPLAIPDSYEKTLALLAASQKYNMNTVLYTVRSEIGRQLPTTRAAFRAYAIAYSKQLIPEIEAAARLTLDHPMTFEVIADALPLFEGSALSDLVRFRKRCRNNLVSFLEGFVYGSDSLSGMWFVISVDCESKDTLLQVPVVQVTENHTIISSLLTFVFPVSPILPPTIEQIVELLSVAEKYRMTTALIRIRDCASRRDPPAELDFSLTEGEIRSQSSTLQPATTEALPLPEGLNLSGADIILRSSDLVSFHVHKSILAMSSPFFTNLFSLPQPPDGEVIGGLPVVQVSEDAELLHNLFTVLYPGPLAIPDSYEKTLALLAASQKYNMTTVLS